MTTLFTNGKTHTHLAESWDSSTLSFSDDTSLVSRWLSREHFIKERRMKIWNSRERLKTNITGKEWYNRWKTINFYCFYLLFLFTIPNSYIIIIIVIVFIIFWIWINLTGLRIKQGYPNTTLDIKKKKKKARKMKDVKQINGRDGRR